MAETRQTVTAKVTTYVNRVFGGTDETAFKRAFEANDLNADGLLSLDEVSELLDRAGVGFRLTRWAIAKEICDVLDTDGDGKVAWAEFANVFRATKS